MRARHETLFPTDLSARGLVFNDDLVSSAPRFKQRISERLMPSDSLSQCTCGTFLVGNLTRCPSCGRDCTSKVSALSANPRPIVPATPPIAASNQPPASPIEPKEPTSRASSTSHTKTLTVAALAVLATLVVGLALALVISLGVFFWWSSSDRSSAQAEPGPSAAELAELERAARIRSIEDEATSLMNRSQGEILSMAYPTATLQGVRHLSTVTNADGTFTVSFAVDYTSHESLGGAANHFEVLLFYSESGVYMRSEFGNYTGLLRPGESTEILGQFLRELLTQPQ